MTTAFVVTLTPSERDLLLSLLCLAEELDADLGQTRPLAEILEKALTMQEAQRAVGGMVA